MPRLEYLHLDVFTSKRFEGNQLAVFPDARGLDPGVMQAIAREINFSETTFILPPERSDTDTRMRIFTPGIELPMAGHPTVGSTFALAHLGRIAPDRDAFVFGLGVGPTRVELTWDAGQLAFAWMDQRLPDVRTPVSSVQQIVRAAGVAAEAFSATGLPVQEISCGAPYVLVPIVSRTAIDAAEPDLGALKSLRSAFGETHVGIYLFSTERASDDVTAYSRMFAAGLGIPEDPATGSACGPLGCYLAQHDLLPDSSKIVVSQGVAMGRPSRIHVAIARDAAGAITRVQVGGQAVLVAEGRFGI